MTSTKRTSESFHRSSNRGLRRRLVGSVVTLAALLTAPAGLAWAQEPPPTEPPTVPTSPTTVTPTSPTTVTPTSPTTEVPPDTDPSTTPSSESSTSTTDPDEPGSSTTTTTAKGSVTDSTIKVEELTEEQKKDLAAGDTLTNEELELLQRYIASRLRLGTLRLEMTRSVSELDRVEKELLSNADRARKSDAELERTAKALDEAQAELDSHTDRLRKTAIDSYIAGGLGSSSAAALLKAESVDDLTRSRVYVGAVVDDEQGMIDQASDLRAWVDGLKADATRQNEAAVAAREAQQRLRSEKERQVEQKQAAVEAENQALLAEKAILDEVTLKSAAFRERMAQQAIVSGSIESQLRAVGAVQGPSPELVDLIGTMIHPLPKARLSQGYGPRIHPLFQTPQGHQGIDLAIAQGEPIYAAQDGIVIFAGNANDGYGNKVIIAGDNKVGTLYAHQYEIIAKVGDEVRQGDVIGLVGSTGYSTGPHLHFEVRVNGTPVNPAPVIGIGM